MIGDYTVDGFDALIANGATNNASFSVVLVYRDSGLTPRRIGLWDGLQTMHSTVNPSAVVTLANLEVDNPAEGDLTWYVLEGDFGGSLGEQVSVVGQPGGSNLVLSDTLNPADNPMNHTINTTVPTQAWSMGVDIDQFDVSAALTPGDTSVDMTYQAGDDKWWINLQHRGRQRARGGLRRPVHQDLGLRRRRGSERRPTAGDTLRYTIHLVTAAPHRGCEPRRPHPRRGRLLDAGGRRRGVDASTATDLVVTGIPVAAGSSVDVLFDVVLGECRSTRLHGQRRQLRRRLRRTPAPSWRRSADPPRRRRRRPLRSRRQLPRRFPIGPGGRRRRRHRRRLRRRRRRRRRRQHRFLGTGAPPAPRHRGTTSSSGTAAPPAPRRGGSPATRADSGCGCAW